MYMASGGQTAGEHQKAFPRPRQPFFAVPALRELEGACRVSILCDAVTVHPQSAFHGVLQGGHQRGSAAVCDPNPPHPFARYRICWATLKFSRTGESERLACFKGRLEENYLRGSLLCPLPF